MPFVAVAENTKTIVRNIEWTRSCVSKCLFIEEADREVLVSVTVIISRNSEDLTTLDTTL